MLASQLYLGVGHLEIPFLRKVGGGGLGPNISGRQCGNEGNKYHQ